MGKYANGPTAEKADFYHGIENDKIMAITSALSHNIGTHNKEQARIDYFRLVRTIKEGGYHGKDIRYVRKKLNVIVRFGKKPISGIAKSYIDSLPKPIGGSKRKKGGYPKTPIIGGLFDFSDIYNNPYNEIDPEKLKGISGIVISSIIDKFQIPIDQNEPHLVAFIKKLEQAEDFAYSINPNDMADAYAMMVINSHGHDPGKIVDFYIESEGDLTKFQTRLNATGVASKVTEILEGRGIANSNEETAQALIRRLEDKGLGYINKVGEDLIAASYQFMIKKSHGIDPDTIAKLMIDLNFEPRKLEAITSRPLNHVELARKFNSQRFL